MKVSHSNRLILPLCLLVSLSASLSVMATQTPTSEQIEAKVDQILSKMTLEEKIGQTAMRGTSSRDKGPLKKELTDMVARGGAGAFLNVMIPENVDELQRIAVEESRLGIPLIFSRDVIHGFKTIFPIPLALAASWNPENAEVGARVSAFEGTTAGIRWTFAPMMDIARDPRWGRIAESFGEDPYLTSQMAVAMVNGFQTDDLSDPTAMAACAKHFVGYGAAEGGRDYNTAMIPQRELHDIYLKPFKAAADAGCATMMSSFNEIDGIPASGNKYLLTNTLRDDWGWDGFLVSDWDSIVEMIDHGYAADEKEAAKRAINAGLNMEMTSRSYEHHLAALVEEGLVEEAWIDEMVRQILRIKFRLGLFENPYHAKDRGEVLLLPENLEKAKKAAIESVVMLKNKDSILPLNKDQKQTYAVIGPLANAPHEQMGTWVFDGRGENSIVPVDAIRDLVGDASVHYAPGLTHSRDRSENGFQAAMDAAENSDVILFFAGEEAILSGEAHSRSNIDLPGAQNQLIAQLSSLGKPLVLIVMSGRPNTIQTQVEQSDAVLIAFHGGNMAGPALADLLFGIASPSGRLPVTWPINVGQIPIYYNHKNTGRPASDKKFVQMDDIEIGAWQSSLGNQSHYLDIGFRPAYPFGFGLTYSTFEYSDLHLSSESIALGGNLKVSATITNTGNAIATEVVQLYVRDLVGDVTRPVRELKGFERVTLKPGESRKVSFTLHTKDLSFHNLEMQEVTEPGDFQLWIAPNAVDGLTAGFRIQ